VKIIHVGSISTGKDSEATIKLMIDRVGKENCRFVMADTGNEDPLVFSHLAYLETALGIKIDILKADFSEQIANKREFIARDQRNGRKNGKRIRWTNKAKRRALSVLHPTGNPFLDLCMWKGRFPSRRAQFCTEQLKTIPMVEYQMALMDQGYGVISWQGIRRDESEKRKNARLFEKVSRQLRIFRPIILWTAQQTIDYCLSKGLKVTPLYSEGFDRVGCMPCINCDKKEVSNIDLRRPHEIERIAEWERLVTLASKRGGSTFFPSLDRDEGKGKHGIYEIVEWAKTTHGGKQYNLLQEIDSDACSSSYGLCDK
jgi:3'-phosphoadenosine 5'-phosphosulfate sulfotransferase (PAPS reductase)/FAD synthetase